MPEYTKQETLQRVQKFADDYQNAIGMIDEQNDYFNDISEAIQGKTGQATPYDKSEMADAIDELIKPNFETKEVTPSTIQQNVTVTPSTEYNGLEKVIVKSTPLETATVTPTTQQQTITPQSPAIGFSSVTVEGYTPPAPVEEKDVNFYDYDGTVLYSYTLSEIAELTELPPLPIHHERLTCQEWNWTLEDIKSNGTQLMVGAVYTTKDGSTQLDYEFSEYDGDVIGEIGINIYSPTVVTADWGDGTVETISLSASSNISHTYQTNHKKGILKLSFSKQINYITLNDSSAQRSFGQRIKALHIGDNNKMNASYYAFYSLLNLVALTIPNTVESFGTLIFQPMFLENIILPKNISIGANAFPNSLSLKRFISPKNIDPTKLSSRASVVRWNIPNSITTIAGYSLTSKIARVIDIPEGVTTIVGGMSYQATGLNELHIPKSVTTMGDNIVFQCQNLQVIDLSAFDDPSSIPTITTTTFAQMADAKLYFRNQTMLDAFASATNWSAYADSFVIGGRYADGGNA